MIIDNKHYGKLTLHINDKTLEGFDFVPYTNNKKHIYNFISSVTSKNTYYIHRASANFYRQLNRYKLEYMLTMEENELLYPIQMDHMKVIMKEMGIDNIIKNYQIPVKLLKLIYEIYLYNQKER